MRVLPAPFGPFAREAPRKSYLQAPLRHPRCLMRITVRRLMESIWAICPWLPLVCLGFDPESTRHRRASSAWPGFCSSASSFSTKGVAPGSILRDCGSDMLSYLRSFSRTVCDEREDKMGEAWPRTAVYEHHEKSPKREDFPWCQLPAVRDASLRPVRCGGPLVSPLDAGKAWLEPSLPNRPCRSRPSRVLPGWRRV